MKTLQPLIKTTGIPEYEKLRKIAIDQFGQGYGYTHFLQSGMKSWFENLFQNLMDQKQFHINEKTSIKMKKQSSEFVEIITNLIWDSFGRRVRCMN